VTSSKLAYYERFPRDYIADTITLNLEEHGAYTLLLDYQWLHGSVPGTSRDLASIWKVPPVKARKLWASIELYFPANKRGQHMNGRMERERVKAEGRIAKASNKGSAGAKARWAKYRAGNAQAMPEQCVGNGPQEHVAGAVPLSLERGSNPELIGTILDRAVLRLHTEPGA